MREAKVTMLDTYLPAVHYSPLAFRQRQYIVARNKEEVGWFGTGDRLDDGDFLIDRLYVPEQRVHPTECEISDDATGDFAEALLADGDCPTRFLLWGHSHVNMSTGPSGTDDEQLEKYLEHVDTFIRAIYNKKGEERHDIYLKDQGIVINYADSGVYVDPLPTEELAALDLAFKVNIKSATFAYAKTGKGAPPYTKLAQTERERNMTAIYGYDSDFDVHGNYIGVDYDEAVDYGFGLSTEIVGAGK